MKSGLLWKTLKKNFLMVSYLLLITIDVFESLKVIHVTNRRAILAFIYYLAENSFDEGDYETLPDKGGKSFFVKGIRGYILTYYVDHPAMEIKVISLVKNKKFTF